MNKKEGNISVDTFSCPLPINSSSLITLAHGGGGKLTQQLIEQLFRPAFNNPELETQHDGAVFEIPPAKLAFTTDSYVVRPLIFPGGNIGNLAVNGTVNDLAMCGARPLYLTAAFILEEGLPVETLWTIVQSMKKSADHAGVNIVTGDTKVVDKGKGDGIFINTSGVGVIEHNLTIHPKSIQPGDVVLLSGDIGRHGIAIMAVREGLGFQSQIESDCAAVSNLVQSLIDADIEIHCMRDLTRGGLATALIEMAQTSKVSINITETEIPVREDVKGACEILGLDPLYVANEGQFVAFVKADHAKHALDVMQKNQLGGPAKIIGTVKEAPQETVILKTKIGTLRMLDMLSGEQLPRIC
ncbi:MAG: hydrogenase expression/formation protein HypE [Nitrospina sp.]|jgi:hydrogenase expression/formation protein HypE|nr:hydrogenase expression/formation protein HypE [Nitrospina sp.]